VPSSSPSLWRSQIFPFYDGLGWERAFGQLRTVAGPPWVVGTAGARTRTDTAIVRGRDDGTIWSPGEPAVLRADRTPLIRTDGLGSIRSSGPLDKYVVESTLQETDPARLRAAGSAPVAARSAWLQLPASLPGRVRALSAQLTAGAPTSYDAVRRVETWLRANATYRLDSPVPVRGEDAVDRFLFVDRTGFCEQFAAAQVVLLRAAGIPARLATGLAGGSPAGGGRRLYRESDLHAWVEVQYAGIGWSPSDPTAGATLAAGVHGSLRARLASLMNDALRHTTSLPGGRVTLAALLLLCAAAVASVARARSARPMRLPVSLPPPPPKVGPALAAFLRYDAQLGPRRRRPAETLSDLAARLEDAPVDALRVVEVECYAAEPPGDAAAAAEALDRLAPSRRAT
jgi:transglutaminase-like putative cysteine protease